MKKGLVKKTIRKHLSNVDLYINDYLNYYDITKVEDGMSSVHSFLDGWFIEKWNQNSMHNYIMHGVGMVIGTAVCYLLGSFWLSYQADMSIMAAITAGVIPFISGDVVKIIIGIFVGVNIRKKLTKAGML